MEKHPTSIKFQLSSSLFKCKLNLSQESVKQKYQAQHICYVNFLFPLTHFYEADYAMQISVPSFPVSFGLLQCCKPSIAAAYYN